MNENKWYNMTDKDRWRWAVENKNKVTIWLGVHTLVRAPSLGSRRK